MSTPPIKQNKKGPLSERKELLLEGDNRNVRRLCKVTCIQFGISIDISLQLQ